MKGEHGVIRDLGLSKSQIGDSIIAAVSLTFFARLLVGPLCDRFGARRTYTVLLAVGSIPVMLMGLCQTPTQFIIARSLVGAIGAAFVITQYHTSVMFAPSIIGTANATTAGWGNLGGGVTQAVMPLVLAALVTFGVPEVLGWRVAMVVPGVMLLLTSFAYYFLTTDTPKGNFTELRERGEIPKKEATKGGFWESVTDVRVIVLFFIYAACFGVELTLNGTAAMYFFDTFELNLTTAGLLASLFGLMNLFARSLGGLCSDKLNRDGGLQSRAMFLFVCLFLEGIFLILFSQMSVLWIAVPVLIVFSLFVQMAEGATFAIVPYINKRAVGSVSGIVGAGGNFGAILAGFLFKFGTEYFAHAYLIMGSVVVVSAFCAFAVRFSPEQEAEAKRETRKLIAPPPALSGVSS